MVGGERESKNSGGYFSHPERERKAAYMRLVAVTGKKGEGQDMFGSQ